jgi:hypothetical protein
MENTNPLAILSPSCTIVSSASGTGKSVLDARILENVNWWYDKKVRKILYFYSVHQELYEQLEQKLDNISFFNCLPTNEILEQVSDVAYHDVVVIDDLMSEAANSSVVEDLFVRKSHHSNTSLIIQNQNLFCSGKHRRTQNSNSQYTIFLKNPCGVDQVATFAKQRFPGRSQYFMSAYFDATDRLFSYLLVDSHPKSDARYALRNGLFPGDDIIVYSP